MTQEIIVGIIGVLLIAYIAYKLYDFFFKKSADKGSCGCGSCHCNVSKKSK